MTRDYAKYRLSPKKSTQKSSYLGLWALVLLLFAAFTAGLMYLGKSKIPVIPPERKVLTEETTTTVSPPKFDFYTLSPPKKNSKNVAEYELGIARVKDYAAADRLKAELTLLGFSVSIIPKREDQIQKHYVSVGPYNDKESAMADLEKLKQNKIYGELKKID